MAKKIVKKSKFSLQSPKGMHDILPPEQPLWEKLRRAANKTAASYNFLRIDTPALESAEIFERSGEETDIVEKQMYYVKSRGKDRLVLRPEGTAPVMRAYLQHDLSKISQPLKIFYFCPMFRYEQPQAGRYRQFHQAGFEVLGSADPIYDAQIISAAYRLIGELKIKNLVIQINSIGCRQCRSAYVKKLKEYYKDKKNQICKNCRNRLINRPLRLLDCKEEKCAALKAEAPVILDKLCAGCSDHFKRVLEYLDELALPYVLNHYLVRGLDYYNRTVFEIFFEGGGTALASGGRYDDLSEMFGARKTSAVGSSVGAERVVELMKSLNIAGVPKPQPQVFIIHIGDEAKKKSLSLFEKLREADIRVVESFGRESLRSQLKTADKEKAILSLIIGQKEVFEESVIIRNMETGVQETAPFQKIAEEVKKKLK